MTTANNNKTIIVGLGQTGLACLRFLVEKEPASQLTVVDTRQAPPQLTACRTTYANIDVHLGQLPEALLLSAKRIIVSPGMALSAPIWQRCRQKQIPIIGDVELFAHYAKAPIIGITGSNGKGTVTTLVAAMATVAGHNAVACGNIGYAVLDALLDLPVPDWYVAELSSFQLASTYSLHTHSAVMLNLSLDHLDYHGTMAHYRQSKQRIYQHCSYPIINRDALDCYQDYDFSTLPISYGLNVPPRPTDYGIVKKDGQPWLSVGTDALMATADLRIVGQHNWQNALAAIALAQRMQLPNDVIIQTLRQFSGLAHRCQWVASEHGVTWYNDSKGTNVAATMAAISAVADANQHGRVILLMGGQAKGADFRVLIPIIKQYVRQLYVFGEDADKIMAALSQATIVTHVPTLRDATVQAKQHAKPGDCVLLSPACASFDMFCNFIERGEHFIDCVKRLAS